MSGRARVPADWTRFSVSQGMPTSSTMLALSRQRGRALILELADGRHITIGIKKAGDGDKVRLLVDVPDDVVISRDDAWPVSRQRVGGQD